MNSSFFNLDGKEDEAEVVAPLLLPLLALLLLKEVKFAPSIWLWGDYVYIDLPPGPDAESTPYDLHFKSLSKRRIYC